MNKTVTNIYIRILPIKPTIIDLLESTYLDLAHIENQLNVLITDTIVDGINYDDDNAPNTVNSFMRAYNSLIECIDSCKQCIDMTRKRLSNGESLNDLLF